MSPNYLGPSMYVLSHKLFQELCRSWLPNRPEVPALWPEEKRKQKIALLTTPATTQPTSDCVFEEACTTDFRCQCLERHGPLPRAVRAASTGDMFSSGLATSTLVKGDRVDVVPIIRGPPLGQ